tara:strand:- start:4048 stop:4341 length:294 start_codon:yes stop_codon:yes gene_type:complete
MKRKPLSLSFSLKLSKRIVNVDQTAKHDPVNHPSHYTFSKIEVLDAIEEWGVNFHTGNIIKYLLRAGRKTENPIQDLQKAEFYLKRLIKLEEEKLWE